MMNNPHNCPQGQPIDNTHMRELIKASMEAYAFGLAGTKAVNPHPHPSPLFTQWLKSYHYGAQMRGILFAPDSTNEFSPML